jgi:hypothetical protein
MMKFLLVFSALCFSCLAHSAQIATCSKPSGYVYFHSAGIVKKEDSGWTTDKVSKGLFSVVQDAEGNTDLLFVDGRDKPFSSKEDGAQVLILQKSKDSFKVLVHYGDVTEIYSFFKEGKERLRFSYFTTKGGDSVLVPKASLLVGDCTEIAFEKVKK